MFKNSRLKFKSGAVYLTTYDKICYFSRVEGPSMKPLINSGPKRNFVLVIRPIANLFGVPPMETILKRGDVVSIVSPKNPNDCFLKRVIGLPGDIVETITYKRKFVRVPDGHCWIEGDNFRVSHDSNEFGCVPLGLVSGQAKLIIYPLSDLSKIESKLPNHRKIKKRLANDDNERETFIIGFKSNKQKGDEDDDDDDDEEDDEDVDDSDDKTDDKNY